MNPYDLAHQLARALAQSTEYAEFKKARDLLEEDARAKEMLKDLRKKQLEVEALQLSGKTSEEASNTLENLNNIVSYNSLLSKYLEAEQRFALLMVDIQSILAKAVDLGFDM